MKKILPILLLLLVGCQKGKFYLNDEYYNGSLEEINYEYIDKLNDSSYLLFVYTKGCTTCASFKVVLNDFINDYNIKVYMISYDEIKNTKINKYVKYTPSLVIYNNGKLVDYLDATKNEDLEYYNSKEGLVKWLDKYIYLEKLS